MRIGQVLEQARERAGLEITDIEDSTKIRGKYLRALESEDWGELPSSAYAKGFLRTYGQLLGLDSPSAAATISPPMLSSRRDSSEADTRT